MISPTTYKVADLLRDLGWSSPNDAQWTNLDMAIANGKLVSALFSGEQFVRDAMQEKLDQNGGGTK